jgi:fimbrial isopeptide formation D2 family protein
VARTGSGAPGLSFAGLGQGGGDAVVGATGADGIDDGFYRVAAATVSFVKSASVADPFGGSTQVPGATITYTLAATIGGNGSLANLRITDPVPAGTTYTAASITLDGAALTDAADADSGSFSGTGISVGLGNVAAGTTRTVTFKVKID